MLRGRFCSNNTKMQTSLPDMQSRNIKSVFYLLKIKLHVGIISRAAKFHYQVKGWMCCTNLWGKAALREDLSLCIVGQSDFVKAIYSKYHSMADGCNHHHHHMMKKVKNSWELCF
uniref:Uncharacterized protein n=1 Tax=Glossina austeni TaxID=7395 RepID=A0A1A9UGU2_GLOAU